MEMKLTADNKKLLWIFILAFLSFLFCSNAFAGGLKVLHEKSFNVNPGETLELESESGDIVISTWSKNEVFVKVYGNRKAEERVDFSFERTSDGVRIIAEKEGSFFNWFSSVEMRFEIRLPAEFNADVKTSGGDIAVKDLKGKMIYKTSGGDVDLQNTNGALTVKTSGGDIELSKHEGNSKLSSSGGDIKCIDTKGDLDAGTSGGGIILKTVDGRIDARTSGGDITLDYTGVNNGIELTTSGGDIEVYIPAEFKADADLKCSGGHIDCDFTLSRTYRVKSYHLEADFNGGGEKLYCKTSGGDIYVKEK